MPIWFYSKSPEHRWLSNLSEHGFELDGPHWPSVERYYQAQKAAPRASGSKSARRINSSENRPISAPPDLTGPLESTRIEINRSRQERHAAPLRPWT